MKAAIEDEANDVCLSIASIWEIIIKHQSGKLPLPEGAFKYVKEQSFLHGIRLLDIEAGALEKLEQLPALHRDPFDRVILSQSQQYQCRVLTVDPFMLNYPGIMFFS